MEILLRWERCLGTHQRLQVAASSGVPGPPALLGDSRQVRLHKIDRGELDLRMEQYRNFDLRRRYRPLGPAHGDMHDPFLDRPCLTPQRHPVVDVGRSLVTG